MQWVTQILDQYWSIALLKTNALIVAHLVGAMAVGLLMGYERTYQGRAAGMRTYALVCTASCALTVFVGFPASWFGGALPLNTPSDPTRVIQGIITGIGFLGSAVIIKDGFSISGLSTAASIWVCCAIGILIGVGFYTAAITLAVMSVGSMVFISSLEEKLQLKRQVHVKLRFKEDFIPDESRLIEVAKNRGYFVSDNGISVTKTKGCVEWTFMASAIVGAKKVSSVTQLASELASWSGVLEFYVSPYKS